MYGKESDKDGYVAEQVSLRCVISILEEVGGISIKQKEILNKMI